MARAYTISAKVTTQRALARLGKVYTKIEKAGRASVSDLVNIGKETARALAPKDSGTTYKSIKSNVKKTSNGTTGEIKIDPYITPLSQRRFGTGKVEPFSLVAWMHLTGGKFKSSNPYGRAGKQHIHSGDPQFMFTTRRILNGMAKGKVQGNIAQINL